MMIKEIIMLGTRKPKRKFLYVDELADASVHLINSYSDESHENVSKGKNLEFLEIANTIKEEVEFEGKITNDLSKPEGTPRKLLDVY